MLVAHNTTVLYLPYVLFALMLLYVCYGVCEYMYGVSTCVYGMCAYVYAVYACVIYGMCACGMVYEHV